MQILRAALFSVLLATIMGLTLFGAAGRVDVPMFWVYLAVWLAIGSISLATLDPELARERMRPAGPGKDNLTLLRILAGPLFLSHLILAGLDVGRFHWSPAMPWFVSTAGLVVFTGAFAWATWARNTNRFFSSAVRIQTDRGHHVVTAGPYHFVRHPGYLGFIVISMASSIALGSWAGLIPVTVILCAFIRRTALEDRMLQGELAGYADYAKTVRYRLVPGVW